MTEIFGTLGPACADYDILDQMFKNGMTGIRLNMSHTSLCESEELLRTYHSAAAANGRKGDLLIDLQGPELRISVREPMNLSEGDLICFGKGGIGIDECVVSAMEKGDSVLMDDGRILAVITAVFEDRAEAVIRRGGLLMNRKSIKIEGKDISGPDLTQQDLENLSEAKKYGVTAVMVPFVREGRQLRNIRERLNAYGCADIRIFAKIENRTGMKNLRDIIPYADMIVIARGDLGNDMPLWQLPAAQKDIEDLCLRAGKPFLVVTQMLASMTDHAVPTRAEVSDIFNAVIDGADAVMATNETAAGKYPAEVIRYLKNTADEAEKWLAGR